MAPGAALAQKAVTVEGPVPAPVPQPPPPLQARPRVAPPTAARLKTLVENLGSAFPAVRESAESELVGLGSHAIPALTAAAPGPKPEAAARARAVLDRILADLLVLLDGAGEPLPGATARLEHGMGFALEATSDALGFLDVAAAASPEVLRAVHAMVSHPECGRGPGAFDERAGARGWRTALARTGTAAAERALAGRVVGPDGKPVAGASVLCLHVRTLGEGLINPGPENRVLTGEDGRFRVYSADANPREERGALIPPGSRFSLRVDPPDGSGLFPYAGEHPNAEVAEIRLERPTRVVRLAFEDPAGGRISAPEALREISLTYRKAAGAAPLHLGSSPAIEGRARLAPGLYEACRGEVVYLPAEVTADGPEELLFRLPPAVVYHGRTVDGATGAPVAGALVAGWSGTGRDDLAILGDADWKALEAPEAIASLEGPAVGVLKEHYGILALARSDAEGRFEIVQGTGVKIYGLLAFARNRVPWKQRLHAVSVGPDGRGAAGDLPLFAAARVTVQPVNPEKDISVLPRWAIPKEEGQPAWLDRLLAAEDRSDGEFGHVHWLRLGESQPIFVPAGVRLRLRLEAPYHDEWSPVTIPRWVRLEPGGTLDLGPVAFEAGLPATVEVVDARGKPIEGVPVRAKHDDDRAWSVAHVTDAEGRARFHVHPMSRGEFHVSGIPRDPGTGRDAPNLSTPFREYSGIRPRLHPRPLRCGRSTITPILPSRPRLAGGAHPRSRYVTVFTERGTRVSFTAGEKAEPGGAAYRIQLEDRQLEALRASRRSD